MAQEEEKEEDMAAVETTTAAVQAAAVQQQQQSQPLSYQAETAAAAAAETPDEKAGVERTAGSGGKRAKESDEEVTSPSGEDETKWVSYEQEVDAKRRKLSVKQKRRARKRAGRRAAEEASEGAAEAASSAPVLAPPVPALPSLPAGCTGQAAGELDRAVLAVVQQQLFPASGRPSKDTVAACLAFGIRNRLMML
jgi:hypothetical protein